MKIGTKSLLFGVHNVIWHPVTVLIAWFRLYGRPNFKTLICIVIHDWGYGGKADMDGDEGKGHPFYGAALAMRLGIGYEYFKLCIWHSRHLAHEYNGTPSRLCWADKLSICYDPAWFYLLRARLSGELREYRKESAESGFCPESVSDREWFKRIRAFMREQAMNQRSSTLYMSSPSIQKEVSGHADAGGA